MIVHAKSGAWLIKLAGEDNQNLAEAMLQRALEVNGLIQNAYRPNENYGDQAWYDEITLVNRVTCTAASDGRMPEARELRSPETRPRLELQAHHERRNRKRDRPAMRPNGL